MQHIKIKRGKLGRYRWFLYRDGKYRGSGRVWATARGARRGARR